MGACGVRYSTAYTVDFCILKSRLAVLGLFALAMVQQGKTPEMRVGPYFP